MAAKSMNLVDAVAEYSSRTARNRSAVLRFGTVATAPAAGRVRVDMGTNHVTCAYLRGVALVIGDWVAIINDGDKWFVLGPTTPTGVLARPVPYAIAAGLTPNQTPPVGGDGVSVAIVYPTGRFTQLPVVTTSGYSNGYGSSSFGSATLTGCTVRYFNPSLNTPTSCVIHWMAVQMSQTAAPGARGPTELVEGDLHYVACHTVGCPNADLPIDVRYEDHVSMVSCGPCGREIVDIDGTVKEVRL